MMNFLKTSAVAAVVAIAPMTASAVTILDGGSTLITDSEMYTGLVASGAGGAGMWTHKFEAEFGDATNATADISVVSGTRAAFDDLTVSWLAADGMEILVSDAIDTRDTLLSTGFGNDPDNIRFLKFNWTDSEGGNGFDFEVDVDVAAVPVPAAGMLLLTALGGAAAMRRRTK